MTPFDGQLDVKLMDNIDVANPGKLDAKFDEFKRRTQNITVITIRSDLKPIESIQHHTELTFIELVGFLGGHAHIWLGISFISLYDIFAHFFHRAQLFVRANVIVL